VTEKIYGTTKCIFEILREGEEKYGKK